MASPKSDLREDLPALAELEFRLAQLHCVSCDDYHALWGYERLARSKGNSFEIERDILQRLLHGYLPSHGRALIAGAADAGLLALVAQLTRELSPHITIADRCATPLNVCRRYAEDHGLSVMTAHTDLTAATIEAKHDLAFAHNVLMLLPRTVHVAFLSNIRRSLSFGGVFVLVNRVRVAKPVRLPPAHYAVRIMEGLAERGISLPERESEFRKRLESYADRQHTWSDAVVDLKHVESVLSAVGFRILERVDHDRRRTNPDRDGGGAKPMPTHIFVATAK